MNEKIQALTDRLQEECRKEGVPLLCTIEKGGEGKVIAMGGLPEIGLLLALQERSLNSQSPINAEILRKVAISSFDIEEESNAGHTFVTDDLNDIPDILKNFIRGDYE